MKVLGTVSVCTQTKKMGRSQGRLSALQTPSGLPRSVGESSRGTGFPVAGEALKRLCLFPCEQWTWTSRETVSYEKQL